MGLVNPVCIGRQAVPFLVRCSDPWPVVFEAPFRGSGQWPNICDSVVGFDPTQAASASDRNLLEKRPIQS